MVGTLNLPKVFNDKNLLIETATTKLDIDKSNYDMTVITTERGLNNELKVLYLLSFLDGIKKVFKIEEDTVLETLAKVDIVVLLNNDRLLGFQVKSSEKGAIKHKEKSGIGCIWVGNSDYLEIVLELSRWLKLPLKEEIVNVFKLAKLMRGKTMKVNLLNLSKLQIDAIGLFKLGVLREGYVKF